MGSKMILKNAEETEFKIEHLDGDSALSITSSQLFNIINLDRGVISVPDIATMEAIHSPINGEICFVAGVIGGIYVYSGTEWVLRLGWTN